MTYSNILYTIEDGVATLCINRPEKLNSLNISTLGEIDKAIQEFQKDASVSGCIITGSGEKSFVAGADINEIAALDAVSGKMFSQRGHEIFNRIESSRKPVLAAVNGFALGVGCDLALSCHLCYSSENARFGQPAVNLGVIPGFGGTQRLPRIVGKGRALEMLMSGNLIDAREAERIGLVNRVFPIDQLLTESRKILQTMQKKSPAAIALVIDSVNKGLSLNLSEALQLEINNFAEACATSDKNEGTRAFLEKRSPQFSRR